VAGLLTAADTLLPGAARPWK